MLKQFLKKSVALIAGTSIAISGITAFAASDPSSAEGEYGYKYVYSKYFKLNNDQDLHNVKKKNPEGYAAHISSVKSYSGNNSLYLDSHDAWWKQWFHTNFGCEVPSVSVPVVVKDGSNVYINPSAGTKAFRFTCRIGGDFSHISPNAGLVDTSGKMIKFSEMSIDTSEESTKGWRTFTWDGVWSGTGWLLGIGGTHACKSYIDDIKLEYKKDDGNYVTIFEDDFENAVNTDFRTVNFANVNSLNDTSLCLSWTNSTVSELSALKIVDITDGTENVVFDSASNTAEGVSLAKGAKCYFGISGLQPETYKKYKIVTTLGSYENVETVIDGRTMKSGVKRTDFNYDENGWSFGGAWQAQIGDGDTAGLNNGEWNVDFKNAHSGNASFAYTDYGLKGRLNWYTQKELTTGKRYAVEFYAKAKTGTVKNGIAVYLADGPASMMNSIGEENGWQHYKWEFDGNGKTITRMQVEIQPLSIPNTIYLDDIRFYEIGGSDVISAFNTEPGYRVDEPKVDVSGSKPKLTWTCSNVDGNGVDGLTINAYHISDSGERTKLNTSPIAWNSDKTSFELESLKQGTYELRVVSKYGDEQNGASVKVDNLVNFTDEQFDSVTFNGAFNEFGYGATPTNIDPLSKITKGNIMGSMTVINDSTETLNAVVIGALYKGKTLVDTVINPITVNKGAQEWPAVVFDLTNVENADDYKMSVFVWDSLNGMKPLKSANVLDANGVK